MNTHSRSLVRGVRPLRQSSWRNRRWRGRVAVAAAMSIGLVACGGGTDTSAPDTSDDTTATTDAPDEFSGLGWSLDVPGAWSEADPGVAQKLWSVADGSASVNVLTEDFPAGTVIDLQGYLDAAIPQLASFIDGAEVTDTSFVEGDHHMLAILDYTGTVDSTFIWFRAVIGLDEAASKAVVVTFATSDESVYEAEVTEVTNIALTLNID